MRNGPSIFVPPLPLIKILATRLTSTTAVSSETIQAMVSSMHYHHSGTTPHNLPLTLRSATSLNTFKRHLKTHLFHCSYSCS